MGIFSLFGAKKPLSVEIDKGGNVYYKMFSGSGSFTSLTTDREKIEIILKNPAVLKVFKLNCDLASLGKVNEYKDDKFFLANGLKNIQEKPNKHQSWNQFIWDFMFYNMVGTVYVWRSNDKKRISETSFYLLNPAKITFPNSLETKLDKLDLSDQSINDIKKQYIQYAYNDGTIKNIPLGEIETFVDLSNSVSQNWYKSNSAIDALYKVISNSDIGLDAKNVNLDYSRNFIVTGTQDPNNISQIPMSEKEKISIEQVMNSERKVHAMKSAIEINRFVDDLAKLKLDDAYIADYFIIGSMYGIPRDVLEANLKGITYENQEKSTGKHISYSIQPKVDELMEWFSSFFEADLRIEYNHLPFMQYVEKERAETMKLKSETYKIFVENGMKPSDALKLTGLEL